ncbi:MAG TPA: two-component regulator propeller domain-containing protein [Planctomycetota bacterium]|nr:two-component regulator propeller domain-containing protein [Planctomycetota bacterium]
MIPGARNPAIGAALSSLCLGLPLFAQRSSLRNFDVADGLPASRVSAIADDGAGFLWITTVEGLGRFDGTRFDVFGAKEGLPRSMPNEVREDGHGRLWVALNGDGIARLTDGEKSMFESFPIGPSRAENTVNAVYFDADDHLWLGTEAGIAKATERPDGGLDFELLPESVTCLKPQAACSSEDGAIWFVGSQGLARVVAGKVETRPLAEASLYPEYLCIAACSSDELLIGDDRSLWSYAISTATWTRLPLELATNQGVRCLLSDSRKDIWVGTTNGLIRLRGTEQLLYTTDEGLPDNSIRCAFEDRAGRLWFGTWLGGVVQLGRGDMVSWTRSKAMPNPEVTAIEIAGDGRVLASTINDGVFELDSRGVQRLGSELSPTFDRIWGRFFEIPGTGWVVGTDQAVYVCRGARLDLAAARRLGPEEGCADIRPMALVAGCAPGEVIVTENTGRVVRGQVEPDGSARFAEVLRVERGPRSGSSVSDAMRRPACAPDGRMWIAGRYAFARQKGDEFEFFEPTEGLPSTEVRDVHFDRSGRLWVALRHDGLSRCDDPSAEVPRWTRIGGLEVEGCFALAENSAGHMFAGTSNGVFEIDPSGALLRHFTRAGGLVSDTVNALAIDAQDRVWVATPAGVTRLDPRAKFEPTPVPATWLSHVEVDGESIPIPRRAARRLGPLELGPGLDTLLVDFRAPGFATDEPLRFQLQLAGMDADWSKPQTDPQVRFARLAPGDYKLLVRAVLGSSRSAGEPASLEFRIPPPLWRRPWFVACGVVLLGCTLFALHRVKLRQALALERVRSQIALDLHDELGADLTQVAILAELARRDAPVSSGEALEKVAGLAREMRESLADIVWSVDPRRDRVGDLVARLRQVGNQMVEAGGIEFSLTVDSDRPIESLPIAPSERRGLFLIAKESMHNAVKHAQASRIDVELRVHGSDLSIAVRDDGRGFDPEAVHTGHGLRSLRSRAASLGARLGLRSGSGRGTQVDLALHLRGGPA